MNYGNGPDDLDAALARLQVHDMGAERAAKTRARCVASLAARHRRYHARAALPAAWSAWLEPAAAVGISTVYLAAAAQLSLVFFRAVR